MNKKHAQTLFRNVEILYINPVSDSVSRNNMVHISVQSVLLIQIRGWHLLQTVFLFRY